MKTRVETINAERAKHYLNLNRNNRPVTESKVNQYFTEIQNGKWKEDTGEAIKISKQGFIIDGQHRLLALSKTKIEVRQMFLLLIIYQTITEHHQLFVNMFPLKIINITRLVQKIILKLQTHLCLVFINQTQNILTQFQIIVQYCIIALTR